MPNLDQTGPAGQGPMTGRGRGIGGMISKIASKVLPKPEEKPKPFNEYPIESDEYGTDEQKKIVDMCIQDIEADEKVQADWVEDRRKDLQRQNSEKPSLLEGLSKKPWQSDINLGISSAVSDTYQSTIVPTIYNVDSIHAVATEVNDIDNRDNWVKFAKWMLGKNEVNALPEVDDNINVNVNQGMGMYEIMWDVWFE